MSWFKKEDKGNQFETVLDRLIATKNGNLGIVTADNCMKSPTIHAIVTSVSRRISSTPVHVYKTSLKDGREIKEKVPNHPVSKLLNRPNEWQSPVDYWQDAASSFIRTGRFIAIKGIGTTGPVQFLHPIKSTATEIKQNDSGKIVFKYQNTEYGMDRVHYVRGPARDFISGDSPINDVSVAIALEIAAEEFGATFFDNGAVPMMIFKYLAGSKGFKTPEDQNKFIADFQSAFTGNKRHRAFLLPAGMEKDEFKVDNDKAQFLETRKYQRTVIAGAFGVPPHLVGDLERGTFNNVEQQDKDFTLNVIMPIVKSFESAMERDLLTDKDRSDGIKIRFNLDSTLRATFKERQDGLQVQLANGVISPDDWREIENRNPREDGEGGAYFHSANYVEVGKEANTDMNNVQGAENEPNNEV